MSQFQVIMVISDHRLIDNIIICQSSLVMRFTGNFYKMMNTKKTLKNKTKSNKNHPNLVQNKKQKKQQTATSIRTAQKKKQNHNQKKTENVIVFFGCFFCCFLLLLRFCYVFFFGFFTFSKVPVIRSPAKEKQKQTKQKREKSTKQTRT